MLIRSLSLAEATIAQQERAAAVALLAVGAIGAIDRPERYHPAPPVLPLEFAVWVQCSHGQFLATSADRYKQPDGRVLPAAELLGGTVPGYGRVLKVACLSTDRRAA